MNETGQALTIRALIVEDDPMVRKTLERMLLQSRREKYTVTGCGSLGEGLQLARADPPDVVLLDLALPDSHGTVTVERFAADQPHVPIVVVTGLEEESDSFLAAEKGAQVCLVKGTLDEGLLLRSVRYAIALKHKEEGDLARSENELKTLIENLNDVVFEVSVNGNITYMSPVIERVANYTPAEVTGKSFASFIHPEDLHAIQESFEDVLAGRLHPSDFRVRRKDGTYRWVRTSSRPATNAEGHVVGIHGVLTDITDTREAEKARAMQEAGRQWQVTFDSLNQVMWLLDADFRIERANQATRALLGHDPKSVIGRPCREVLFGGGWMPPDCPVARMRKSGHREAAEIQLGSHWFNVVCEPILDAAGTLAHAVCCINDITDRKQAEDSLRALSSRQEAILGSVPDIIAEVDTDKIYTWMNQAGFQFFGDDAVGREAAFYFEGQQDTYAVVQPIFDGDPGVIYVESWQRRRDGAKRLLAWWCRVLKDANGNVTGALSTARDITEQNQAEEAVRESQRHLQESLRFSDSIFSTSSVGIFTYKASGKCVSANEAAARIVGGTVADLLAQNFHELPTWKRTGMYDAAREALATGVEQRMETHIVTSFGKDTWVDLAFSRFISEGDPHLLVFVTDVGDRKRAEEALRESELKFRTIAEEMRDGVFVTDTKGIITYASPNSMLLFGYAPNEMEGHIFADFLVESEIPKAMNMFQESISGKIESVNLTLMMRRKDKTVFFGELASSLSSEENPAGTIVLIRDITERQLADDALQESEAKYRAVFESTRNVVVVFDAIRDDERRITDWKLRDANSAAVRAMGLPKERVVGALVSRLRPSRAAAWHEAWSQTLEHNKVLTHDLSENGREYSVTMSRMGKDSLLSVGTDMTDRKRAEASIREFSGRLLSVREEEKRRLSAGLHHDVGSMTVGVSARLQAVEEELRAKNTGKALRALKECRGVFNTAVKTLKKLAVDLRPPDLDVLGLSAALRQHFSAMSRDTGLRIVFTDSPRKAKLEPDVETILFRIAQECVNNAARHAKAKRVRVQLSRGNKETRLIISDNGGGFDSTAVMAHPGSGMGLLAMREMAASLGGSFSVRSAIDRGTTVEVKFAGKAGSSR